MSEKILLSKKQKQMVSFKKRVLVFLPFYKEILKELELYRTDYYPGHYYSPIVSREEISKSPSLYKPFTKDVLEIDLNEVKQMELLNKLYQSYNSIPFTHEKNTENRYYYNNNYYSYSDAIFLHLIIRHFKPNSIIEIGSGFSSAVMMDTNEYFLNDSIRLIFIEPYPERLLSILKPADESKYQIVKEKLQSINYDIFETLKENDILFIDSTHVSKAGGDLNEIFFNILPRINKGVLIHFHDIFFPFEYPLDWLINWKGFGWNESYILRAFLMYNNNFEVVLFNTFLEHFYESWFSENMPLCLKNRGGSIWLKKI